MRIGLREIVFFTLVLCIPVGAWWFVFRPNSAKAESIAQEIKAKEHNLTQANRASATIVSLRNEVGEIEKAMGYFKSKLPNQRQIPMVLEQISTLVRRHRLKLDSICPAMRNRAAQIQYAPEGGPYSELDIDIRVEGDFLDFYAFLQELEALERITRVQKLTVEGMKIGEIKAAQTAASKSEPPPPGMRAMGHVKVNFVMSIFYEKSST